MFGCLIVSLVVFCWVREVLLVRFFSDKRCESHFLLVWVSNQGFHVENPMAGVCYSKKL